MKRIRFADNDSDDETEHTILKFIEPNMIFYRGEIKEPEATNFCIKLRKAVSKLSNSRLPVEIFLTSGGGDVYAGISMYEHIMMMKKKHDITVIADGFVASAATLPLMAATTRQMCSHATLLVHAITSYFSWGSFKPRQLKEESDNIETLMQILKSIYKRHCKIKDKSLEKLLEKDKLLTFDECIRFGFVDGKPSNL